MRNVRDYSYLAVLALCMVVVLLLNSGCQEEQFYPEESIAKAGGSDKDAQLIYAAKGGNLSAVQTLLADGANVNAKDEEYGGTPLWMASMSGHIEVVKLLLEAGADVDAKDDRFGSTPLYIASEASNIEVVKLLLEANAGVDATRTGTSALHMASQLGHVEIVKQLLEAGADVDAKNSKYGGTPLWMASSKGRTEVVKLLLEAGADVDATGRISLGVQWDTGWSVWSTDIRSMVAETLGKSREAALKASSKTKIVHVTPLFLASQHGHIEVVKLLLEAGADVNIEVKDPEGVSCTPYIMAKEGGYIEIANLLKGHGAVE